MYKAVEEKQRNKQMITILSEKFYSSEVHKASWEHVAETDDQKVIWKTLRDEALSGQLTHYLAHSRLTIN